MKEMLEVCSDSFTYAVEAFEENSAGEGAESD